MVAHKKGYESSNIASGLNVGQWYTVIKPELSYGAYVLVNNFSAYLSETEIELASVQKEYEDML
jgi:hypothetical protein